MTYDRAYWEQLWAKTLREHPDKDYVVPRPRRDLLQVQRLNRI
jgi:hypothetical protein